MKYFFLMFLIFSTSISHAKEVSFTREYTYKASDLDSKVSARKNTLNLIKAGVLEEIISYTHNANTLEQAQVNNNFKSSFIQQTTSSSAGFLKARILQEDWNGFTMRITAEIKADPNKIRDQLERALMMRPVTQAQTTNVNPQYQQAAAQFPAPQAPMNTSANYSKYMRTAEFTQVIALLQPLKISMNEYFMMNGEWSSSLKQINLIPEEMTDGNFLDKVRLGKNGLIFAYLGNKFGKNKFLALEPKSIMGGMNTRWDCSTNISTKKLTGHISNICKENKRLRYN